MGGMDDSVQEGGVVPEGRECALQKVRGREDGAKILPLNICPKVHLFQDFLVAIPQRRLFIRGKNQRTEHPGFLYEDIGHGLLPLPDQRRHAGLENAGLLRRNLREGVPQQRAVIQADGCDYG